MSNDIQSTLQHPADLRGGTRILIDLERELTPAELDRFVAAAEQAGAPTLTDHFLNLTLRLPQMERSGA